MRERKGGGNRNHRPSARSWKIKGAIDQLAEPEGIKRRHHLLAWSGRLAVVGPSGKHQPASVAAPVIPNSTI